MIDFKKDYSQLNIPSKYLSWLTRPNNISAQMQKVSNNLRLGLLRQEFSVCYEHENKILNTSKALVREIVLLGEGKLWSYGRVVIPDNTYHAYQDIFDNLGEKMIGRDFLYVKENVRRSKFSYGNLSVKEQIFENLQQQINQALGLNLKAITYAKQGIWSRCSSFMVDGYPLMITEGFFKDIPAYPG